MFRRAVATTLLIGAVAVVLAACGDDDGGSSATPSDVSTAAATPTETVRPDLGPAEAVMIVGSPGATKEALKLAVAGGAPARFFLTGSSRDDASFDGANLPGDAIARGASITSMDSAVFDGAYEQRFGRPVAGIAGLREAYDAVYIVALAAAAANSTDTAAVRDHVMYVANSPGAIVNPGGESFAGAVQTLAEGGDINYIGASGQIDFTVDGDLSKGRVNLWRLLGEQIIDTEVRDVDLGAEIGAEVPVGSLSPAEGAPGGPLRIGAVLPLATSEGGAIRDAMQLAADEINAAGGLFGAPIELLFTDIGDDDNAAAAAVQDLQGKGVSAVIGPPGDAALAVAEAASGLHVALTSSAALPLGRGGFTIRAAMSDALELPPLANIALEGDVQVICVIFESGPENQALANAFRDAFEFKGGDVRLAIQLTDGGLAEGALSACLGT